MRTLTCGRGMPWAAHMRRKRSSSTERTSALGSTAPVEHLPELPVAPRARPRDHLRRDRRRRDVEVDLGLLEGSEQRIEGSDRGVVEQRADRRGDRDPAMASSRAQAAGLAVHHDPVPLHVPRGGRDRHLNDRRSPAPSPRARPQTRSSGRRPRRAPAPPRATPTRAPRARSRPRRRRCAAGSANRPRRAARSAPRETAPHRGSWRCVTLPFCRAGEPGEARMSSRPRIAVLR